VARRSVFSRLKLAVRRALPRRTPVLTDGQRIGVIGENAAAAHLRTLGMKIIARNARVPMGEADIVAKDGHVNVIVEVKTRLRTPGTSVRSASVRPEESLTLRKRAKLRRIASWLAGSNAWERTRVDAVGVEIEQDEQGALRVRVVRYWKGIA
jgi:putative endonuclease